MWEVCTDVLHACHRRDVPVGRIARASDARGGLAAVHSAGRCRAGFRGQHGRAWREDDYVNPLYRKRPAEPVGTLGNTWWTYDDDDRLRLPRPALGAAAATTRPRAACADVPVARLAAGPASAAVGSARRRGHGRRPHRDLHQDPPLDDGRCQRAAHARSGPCRRIRRNRDCRPPWAIPPRKRAAQAEEIPTSTEIATVPKSRNPFGLVKAMGAASGDALSLIPGGMRVASQIVKDADLNLPSAPRTILNGRVGGARRFAAQSWEIDRIKRVAKSSGTRSTTSSWPWSPVRCATTCWSRAPCRTSRCPRWCPVSLALRSGDDDGGSAATRSARSSSIWPPIGPTARPGWRRSPTRPARASGF